jgi:hypothetical protein
LRARPRNGLRHLHIVSLNRIYWIQRRPARGYATRIDWGSVFMALALKDLNKVPLLSVVLANLAAFVAVTSGTSWGAIDWSSLTGAFAHAVPAGIGLILVSIVNAQLSSDAKARVVFFRWRNPLPGSEAFTRHAHEDPRVNARALEQALGAPPTDPQEQNAVWYRLFKSIEDHPSVRQVHREFLFTRDYACIALMMALVLAPLSVVETPSFKVALIYTGLLILQFVLVVRAARQHGVRLVRTVLALKSAGH